MVVVVGVVGVTELLLSDGGLAPMTLAARTRNQTVAPGVSPITWALVPTVVVASTQLTPSIDDCTTYSVMSDPPLSLGATQVTVAVVAEMMAVGGAG